MTCQIITAHVLMIGKLVITTIAGLLAFALFELKSSDLPPVGAAFPFHFLSRSSRNSANLLTMRLALRRSCSKRLAKTPMQARRS